MTSSPWTWHHQCKLYLAVYFHRGKQFYMKFRYSRRKWDLVRHTVSLYIKMCRYTIARFISPVTLYEKDTQWYRVRYLEGPHEYVLQWKRPPKGPREPLYLYDEHGTNITSSLQSYLGPHCDFHRLPVTPHLLGYTEIHVQQGDHPIRRFTGHERIQLH